MPALLSWLVIAAYPKVRRIPNLRRALACFVLTPCVDLLAIAPLFEILKRKIG